MAVNLINEPVPGAMLTTLILWSSLAVASQAGERSEWNLAPRLARGQELVYRGTVTEQNLSRGVQFSRTYRLEVRGLVLELKGDAVDLAVLTRLTQQQATTADRPNDSEPASLRFELAELDGAGRFMTNRGPWLVPDGPATLEAGFAIEVPRTSVRVNQTWTVQEANQPPIGVKVLGLESVGNLSCVKLLVEQESPEWSNPRADVAAWRRQDTLWIAPRLGVAQRVHRTLERREAAHREPTYRLTTQYDLESSLRYDGLFLEDRRREAQAIRQFEDSIRALLPKPQQNAGALKQLVARIDQFAEKYPATPYREALHRTRKLALDGSENRVAPQVAEVATQRLAVGKPAPDFLVQDLRTKEAVSLRKCKGRTVLMVFYLPGSESSRLFMRYIQGLAEEHNEKDFMVLGFAMSDDVEKAAEAAERMRLTFPTLAGKSLKVSYEVEATPRFVVVDSQGIVRGMYTGWGPEMPPALTSAIRQCLPAVTTTGGQ